MDTEPIMKIRICSINLIKICTITSQPNVPSIV